MIAISRRQPRPGRRVRRRPSTGSTPSSSCGQGASEQKHRGDARPTAPPSTSKRPTPPTRSTRLDELMEETGRTLVHPFDDPARDRRRRHGRPRDRGGRSRRRRGRRPGRRRRPRRRHPGRDRRPRSAWSPSSPRRAPPFTTASPPASRARRATDIDRRRPERPVRRRASRSRSAAASSVVLVTEDEIEDGFRFLYERAKLACEPAGAAAAAAILAGKIEAEQPGGRRQRRQRQQPEPPLVSWVCDEGGDPSRVRLRDRPLLLRELVRDPLDAVRAERRDLLAVPPVLHGQAEARGHGRPRRALPAPPREGRARSPRRAAE